MKKLLAFLAGLVLSASAMAMDYDFACYVAANCSFGSIAVNTTSEFSDTATFVLGNWNESYGIYEYAGSGGVGVFGVANGITPCGGRGCHGAPYSIAIDSASIDGVLLTEVSPYYWTLPISLTPGLHVFAVTGHATGAVWFARWSAGIQGTVYNLVPLPPPPKCTSDCGDD